MNERQLAEQWDKTGSFMDLCRDEAWVMEAARIEDDCDGRVEAGLAVKAYAAAKYDPALADVRLGMRRKMRLQSILFSELDMWMKEWDIGAAFEAAYTEARRLIRAQLKQATPELTDWIDALLVEDSSDEASAEKPIRAQTRVQLSRLMTEENQKKLEQVIAKAISDRIREVSRSNSSDIEEQTAAVSGSTV